MSAEGKGNYQGVEYAAALIVGRRQLLKTIENAEGYLIARVTASGDVSVFEPKTAEVITSRDKTKRKYGDKVFEKSAAANED